MSEIALRPYLPADLKRCLEIFSDSIDELAADDYDEDQRAAWKSSASDEAAFGKRLAEALTLVATLDGEAAGFASLKGADVLDLLYVAPEYAGRRVGATLIDALARLAAARGAKTLTAQASDTAQSLFQRQGFVAMQRNLVTIDDQWLANTTMTKTLTPAPAASTSSRH